MFFATQHATCVSSYILRLNGQAWELQKLGAFCLPTFSGTIAELLDTMLYGIDFASFSGYVLSGVSLWLHLDGFP